MSVCMSYHLQWTLKTAFPWDPPKCAEGAGRGLFQSFTSNPCYPRRSQWTGTAANVMLIYTKGGKEGLENYRPIILTLVPGKVMEEIVLSTITQYIQDNQVTGLGQHGQVLRDKHDLLLCQGDPLSGWGKAPCMLCIWGLVKPLTPFPTAFSCRNGCLWCGWVHCLLATKPDGWLGPERGGECSDICLWWAGHEWCPPRAVLGPLLLKIFIRDLGEVIKCRQHQVEPIWWNPRFDNDCLCYFTEIPRKSYIFVDSSELLQVLQLWWTWHILREFPTGSAALSKLIVSHIV